MLLLLQWASEKVDADEADKVYLKKAEALIQWLEEADEEGSDEADEDDDDD